MRLFGKVLNKLRLLSKVFTYIELSCVFMKSFSICVQLVRSQVSVSIAWTEGSRVYLGRYARRCNPIVTIVTHGLGRRVFTCTILRRAPGQEQARIKDKSQQA